MKRTIGVIGAALVLVVGLAALNPAVAGKKHQHSVKMKYKTDSATLPSGDIQFALAFCPGGTKVTGGGSSTDGIGLVNEQDIDPGSESVSVFYIDVFDSGASTIRAHAACVKSKSGKASASASFADVDRQREARIEELKDRRAELQKQLEDRSLP
jgi:hypothetical protein